MKNYLFIVRAFNDVDHFTPIMSKILELQKANILFYSSTPVEFHASDNNIQFLKKKYNLDLKYIYNNSQNKILLLEKFYIFLWIFFKNKDLPRIFTIIKNKIFRVIYKKVLNYYIKNDDWTDNLFNDMVPDIIFYDWTSPNKFPYSNISLKAKALSIPIVSLPHGLGPFINNNIVSDDYILRRKKNKKRIMENTVDDVFFDWYIVQNDFLKKRLEFEGLDSIKSNEKILVLGSPRYEKDWIEKKIIFQKKFQFSNNSQDIKIVIFPNKLQYKGDINSIKQIINHCSKLSKNIVIKPHTRGMKIDFLSDIIKKNNIKVIYDSYNSSQLIEWSDLSIMWGTSIGLHALSINKPIIVPIFAQYNQKTIYEHFSRVIIAKDINELEYKVKNYNNYKLEFNNDEGIKEILKNSVYYNSGSSVSEYIKFFERIVK